MEISREEEPRFAGELQENDGLGYGYPSQVEIHRECLNPKEGE